MNFLVAGLRGGGDGEDEGEDGGVGTSSWRFNFSLLVGICFGLKIASMVSPKDTSLQERPSIVRGFGEEATTLQPMPTYFKSYPSTMPRDLQHVPGEIVLMCLTNLGLDFGFWNKPIKYINDTLDKMN